MKRWVGVEVQVPITDTAGAAAGSVHLAVQQGATDWSEAVAGPEENQGYASKQARAGI
jgi:hypothetical protein